MRKKLIAMAIAGLSILFLATSCTAATKAGAVPEEPTKPAVETPAVTPEAPAQTPEKTPEVPAQTPGKTPEVPAETPKAPVAQDKETLGPNILVKGAVLNAERAIKFTVKNPLDEDLMYGAPFTIERLKAGTADVWEKTALTDELAFDMMLRIVGPGAEMEDQVSLAYIKDIEAGTYRIARVYATESRSELALFVNFRVTESNELLYGLGE